MGIETENYYLKNAIDQLNPLENEAVSPTKNREIKLTNRDNGTVGYTIPDLNLHRTFSGGETKTITFEELEIIRKLLLMKL